MANEFVARNGIIALDNSTISGSLSVTNNISGSIFTGSFIGNLIGTSSQALTASFIQASGVVGLNLSQITTGSVTASVNINSGSFNITSGSTNFFFVSSSGNIGIGTTTPTSYGSRVVHIHNAAASVTFLKLSNSTTGTGLNNGLEVGNSGTTAYVYNRENAPLILGTAGNDRVTITGAGLMGINTSTPSSSLQIAGTSGGLLQTTSGSTTGLFVSSSGQVGIGTTTPSASLQVNGGINIAVSNVIGSGRIYGTPVAAASSYLELYNASTGNTTLNSGAHNIQLTTAGTPRIYISSTGNVGISTATPNTRLDVNGNALISGSLTVTGSIVAQTLIVQTVSSSIIYSSGSNIFGDASNDNQIFTGSVLISGSITVSGSVTNNLTASYALNADALDGINSTQLATTGSNIFRGNQSITGSLIVSSSTFATAIIGSGSGVFTVDGTSGRLFSVDDSLSGSLFSVNTAAGLPVIEAFSDNTVRIGQFGKRALFVSQSRVGFGKETSLNGDIDVSGSVVITGSLSVSGSIVNNLTASFAISASYANNFDAGYAKTFSQLTPAVTWSIIHDLNSLVPLIQVYDLSYSQIIPSSIVNTSRSGSSITFATSQSGYVVISTGGITVTGSNAILSQTTPATTWSFAHNLNTQFPVFTVFDSSNNVIMPLQINATNANSASIYFSSPQIGTAVAANGGVGAAASNNATASFTNSSTWTFNHNLNRQNIIVQTYDSSYNQIIPQNIQLTSINTAVITFPTNTSGYAIASIGGVTGQAISASYAFTSSFVLPLSQSVIVTGSGNTTAFQVLTGSAIPAFMVSSSGNIGIGTSNPLEKLDVFGDIRLRTDATGLGPSLILNNGTEAAGNYSQIAFGGAQFPSSYLKGGIAYVTLASTNGRGDMYFLQNSAADGTNATLANAVMVISNSGSVSIGKTSPNARLDVSGSVLISGSLTTTGTITAQTLVVQTVTSSTDFITGSTITGTLASNTHQFTGSMLVSGSLGIGTAPSFPLEISSTSTTLLARFTSNQNEAQIRLVNTSAGGRTYSIGSGGTSSGGARGFYVYDETAGATIFAISGSGNVGIGTSSPTGRLTLQRSGAGASTDIDYLNEIGAGPRARIRFGGSDEELAFWTNGGTLTERMRITNAGNVLIGIDRVFGINTTDGSDNGYLALCGAGADGEARGGHIYLSGNERAADAGTVVLSAGNVSNGTINFRTGAGVERMRVTNGGYLKVSNNGTYAAPTGPYHEIVQTATDNSIGIAANTAASPYGLEIAFRGADPNNATNYMLGLYTTSPSFVWIYRIFSNGTVSARSDARWKKNIETTRNGYLEDLCKLRVVKYNWYNHEEDAPKELGLIAQEVEEVFPNLISYDKVTTKKQVEQEDGSFIEQEVEDGESRSVKTSVLPYMLLKAIQEQQAIITLLTARIEQLENK